MAEWTFRRRLTAAAIALSALAISIVALGFISVRLSSASTFRGAAIARRAYTSGVIEGSSSVQSSWSAAARRCGRVLGFRLEREYSSLFGSNVTVEIDCTRERCKTTDVWRIHSDAAYSLVIRESASSR